MPSRPTGICGFNRHTEQCGADNSCCNQANARFDRWSLSDMGMLRHLFAISRVLTYGTTVKLIVLDMTFSLFSLS
jgi:hypothetical protein